MAKKFGGNNLNLDEEDVTRDAPHTCCACRAGEAHKWLVHACVHTCIHVQLLRDMLCRNSCTLMTALGTYTYTYTYTYIFKPTHGYCVKEGWDWLCIVL